MANRNHIRMSGLSAPPVTTGRKVTRSLFHSPANDNRAPAAVLIRRAVVAALVAGALAAAALAWVL